MHARAIGTRRGVVTVRPLRDGDTATVEAVFEQLGERSRRLRFGGAKPRLLPAELERLARVDGDRHVLVAYAGGAPVAVARLARYPGTTSAEVATAVADEWQGVGIGTELGRMLAADAAAAGITELHATVRLENRPALSLMRRLTTIVAGRVENGEIALVGLVGRSSARWGVLPRPGPRGGT